MEKKCEPAKLDKSEYIADTVNDNNKAWFLVRTKMNCDRTHFQVFVYFYL